MAWVALKIHFSAEKREWMKALLKISFGPKTPK